MNNKPSEISETNKTNLQPAAWALPRGYSNGIVTQGRQIYLAGQIGWDPEDCQFKTTELVGQLEQTLKNIAALLNEAGASAEHIVRMTWFMTDKQAYMNSQREIGRVYREVLGKNFPAMSVVFVKELVEDKAMIEIEATAVIP